MLCNLWLKTNNDENKKKKVKLTNTTYMEDFKTELQTCNRGHLSFRIKSKAEYALFSLKTIQKRIKHR